MWIRRWFKNAFIACIDMNPLQAAALGSIRVYQRHVSPLKGFSCAYSVHTGRCGCSELGYRAIRRFGLAKGWQVLRERMAMCGLAYRHHAPTRRRPLARERGDCDCDLPFDLPCDLNFTPTRGKLDLCDVLSCCDVGSCDWRSSPDQPRKGQRKQHLPPYSNRRLRHSRFTQASEDAPVP